MRSNGRHSLLGRTGLVVAAAAALLLALLAGSATASVTVSQGDTLSHVAARTGVSVESLAAANGIADPDRVIAGTRLVVPSGASAAPSGGAPAGTGVTVAPGDTLSHVAARTGVSVESLAAANGIADPDRVIAGTRLVVPSGASAAPSGGEAPAAGGTHRVGAGETLSGIAAAYGLDVGAIASANGLQDPDRVVAGAVLRLPAGAGSAHPSAASASSGTSVAGMIDSAAAVHGVSSDLARAVAWQESGWQQSARSSAGAVGVMQLMPGTASWFGPTVLGRTVDPYSVSDNIDAGVAYLGYLTREMGDTSRAVGAYYRGPTAVRRHGLGPETQAYVSSVLALRGTL